MRKFLLLLMIFTFITSNAGAADLGGDTKSFFEGCVDECCLEYYTSNEEMKQRFNIDQLKMCNLTLFRPKIRNLRYQQYHDSLLRYAEEFPKIFKPENGWILRIFIDDSLFSNNYTYSDNSDVKQWEGKHESEHWKKLIELLKSNPNVQIVKFTCPIFQDPEDKDYHKGYFGTIARFISMYDSDVEVNIFRDIDSEAIHADLNNVNQWIKTSNKQFLVYKHPGYAPLHIQLNLNYFGEEMKDHIRKTGSWPAGLWACKGQIDRSLWECMIKELLAKKFRGGYGYGIDEIVLQQCIVGYAIEKNAVEIQLTWSYNDLLKKINKAVEKNKDLSQKFEQCLKNEALYLGISLLDYKQFLKDKFFSNRSYANFESLDQA